MRKGVASTSCGRHPSNSWKTLSCPPQLSILHFSPTAPDNIPPRLRPHRLFGRWKDGDQRGLQCAEHSGRAPSTPTFHLPRQRRAGSTRNNDRACRRASAAAWRRRRSRRGPARGRWRSCPGRCWGGCWGGCRCGTWRAGSPRPPGPSAPRPSMRRPGASGECRVAPGGPRSLRPSSSARGGRGGGVGAGSQGGVGPVPPSTSVHGHQKKDPRKHRCILAQPRASSSAGRGGPADRLAAAAAAAAAAAGAKRGGAP